MVGAARAAGAGRGARAANGQWRCQERGEAMAETAGAGELVAQGGAGGHGAGQAAGAVAGEQLLVRLDVIVEETENQ